MPKPLFSMRVDGGLTCQAQKIIINNNNNKKKKKKKKKKIIYIYIYNKKNK